MKKYDELKDTPFFRELRPLKPEDLRVNRPESEGDREREKVIGLVRQQVDMVVGDVRRLEERHVRMILSIRELTDYVETLLTENRAPGPLAPDLVRRMRKVLAEVDV